VYRYNAGGVRLASVPKQAATLERPEIKPLYQSEATVYPSTPRRYYLRFAIRGTQSAVADWLCLGVQLMAFSCILKNETEPFPETLC
jgi:hypothetical protein